MNTRPGQKSTQVLAPPEKSPPFRLGTGIIGCLHRKCKGSDMNRLSRSRQVDVLNLLLEGCSIRATARLTGVHKTTIASLLVDVGEHCHQLLDAKLRNLPCPEIQADEVWTYVWKKQRHLTSLEHRNEDIGDQYLFLGLDPRSKVIAAYTIGKRNAETTTIFLEELRARVPGRMVLHTDGFGEYLPSAEEVFGCEIDFYADHRTVHVERTNGTLRQQLRRFTRRTLAFSKKLRNLKAAVALYLAHYNFCRLHGSLDMTPAMALGITDTIWQIEALMAN